MNSICHTFASFRTTQAKLIEPVFQSFYKDLLIYEISLPHPRLFKVTDCCFLTIFNKLSLQHLLNHKCYRLFSEACLKIPKLLLPSSQKDTFVSHPVLKLIRCLLFSTIKDWGISTSDLTVKAMKFKYECYEICYAEVSEKK